MNAKLRALYTVEQLAALANINKWTIWHWVSTGRIPTMRVGKSVFVSINDLRAALPEIWANICTKNALEAGQCEACGAPIKP